MVSLSDLIKIVETIKPVQAVSQRTDADNYNVYVLELDADNFNDEKAIVRSRVMQLLYPEELFLDFTTDRNTEGLTVLWERPVTAIRKKAPRARRKKPAVVLPSRAEAVQLFRGAIIQERNKLIVEENVNPLMCVGYVIDPRDPLCPPRFKALAENVKEGDLPILAGVMTKDVICRHVDPIARKIEKMPEPMIIELNPPDPKIVRILRFWKNVNEIPVVVIYEGKLSLSAIIVPTIVMPT